MINSRTISKYDYDHFCSICYKEYGILPTEYVFEVDYSDPENPKCSNYGAVLNHTQKIGNFCIRCGGRLKNEND